MARNRISITVDEGLIYWLETEERNNPSEYKNFSAVVEAMITKGIQSHEREKLAKIHIETGRHGEGETGPSLPCMQGDPDANLELMPELRSP